MSEPNSDAARLDWIEENCIVGHEVEGWKILTGHHAFSPDFPWDKTLREAIDAAMTEQGEDDGDMDARLESDIKAHQQRKQD